VFFCYFGFMTKKKRQKPVTVGFIALGCPKNVVDSERMLAEIAQAGLLITAEPSDADVVVINTCGFIAPAKAEALEAIKRAVKFKTAGMVKKVIVTGCLSERLGSRLLEQTDGVDAVVGLGQRDNIARIIRKTLCSKGPEIYIDHSPHIVADDRGRLLITPSHWAYLRISEGCAHNCSFCTIPAIRGPFRSKPQQLILAEAAELASAGVVELNIIAQDTTYWGRDLKIKNGLSKLLAELEGIEMLRWIRLMYLYPMGIDDELIETVASSEKIVNYFDIPIQHINDKILKDMRRGDTKEHIYSLIEKLRMSIAGVILRTTIMVGFAGETASQFEELVEFVKRAQFDALGCFRYYRELGTAAAEMSNQVPDELKEQRAEELMLTQQGIVFSKNKTRIGTNLICLVDSVDNDGTAWGRFYGQAPDIDSVCIIEECSAKPGQFIDVKVIGSKDYDLLVQQI